MSITWGDVPKTKADVDELVKITLEFCKTEGITDLPEARIRMQAEDCVRFRMPFHKPFTDAEMAARDWG